MTKVIFMQRGNQAFVSDGDYEYLSRFRWTMNDDGKGKNYAYRREGKKKIYMHREITACPPGLVVDHINGNTLDNTRNNLRVCTKKANKCNHNGFGAVPYKGVSLAVGGKKFRARIFARDDDGEGDEIYLGTFTKAEDAAIAYDAAALVLFGEYAWLNFPITHNEGEYKDEAECSIPF